MEDKAELSLFDYPSGARYRNSGRIPGSNVNLEWHLTTKSGAEVKFYRRQVLVTEIIKEPITELSGLQSEVARAKAYEVLARVPKLRQIVMCNVDGKVDGISQCDPCTALISF